ncbi:unnamed protein product, partial [Closterium sp. NIES-64]
MMEFNNAQDAKEAQQRCDGMVVDGARIIVEMSKPTNQPSNPPRCFTCGKEGHRSTDCPDRQRQHHSQVVCFGCKQPGHLHKHCPNRPAMPPPTPGVGPSGSGVILDSAASGMPEAAASGGVKCFGCNASGHVLKDCPQISGAGAGADQHEKQRRWDKRHSSPTSRQHSPSTCHLHRFPVPFFAYSILIALPDLLPFPSFHPFLSHCLPSVLSGG